MSAPAHDAAVAKVCVHHTLAQAELPLAAALLLCGRRGCCVCLLLQLLQLVPECRGVCIPVWQTEAVECTETLWQCMIAG
jgi:hypothetical protein